MKITQDGPKWQQLLDSAKENLRAAGKAPIKFAQAGEEGIDFFSGSLFGGPVFALLGLAAGVVAMPVYAVVGVAQLAAAGVSYVGSRISPSDASIHGAKTLMGSGENE